LGTIVFLILTSLRNLSESTCYEMVESHIIIKSFRRGRPNREIGSVLDRRHSSPGSFLRLGPTEMTHQEIAKEVAKKPDFFREQCRLFFEWMDEYAEALRTRSREGPPRLDPRSEEYKQERKEFRQAQKEYKEGKRERKPEWSDVILRDYMTASQGDDYCLTFRSGDWRPVELVHPLGYFGLPVTVVPRGHPHELTVERRRHRDCVLLSFVHARETRDDAVEPGVFPGYSRRNFDLMKFWWDLRAKLDTAAGEGMIQRAWCRVKAELEKLGQKPNGNEGTPMNVTIQNLNFIAPNGNATINIDQHTEYRTYLANLLDTVGAQPEDSSTFAKVAKKMALDIIGGALKDVAKGRVKEAAKQIYELGKDLGPVVVNTAAYAFVKSCLGQ